MCEHSQFAPGKVILLGEHAVVYGVPAIACALDIGATARASLLEPHATSVLEFEGNKISVSSEHPIGKAFLSLIEALQSPPVRVTLACAIPSRCGLGASAAHGVAIARAILRAIGHKDPERRLTLTGATAWEKVFHGTPSGVDIATVLSGSCIRYRIGAPVKQLAVPQSLVLVVAIADAPASTKDMVDRVAHFKKDRTARWNEIERSIAACVEMAEKCIESGRQVELGEELDRNHAYLRLLGLSTPAIERARIAAKNAGALGAKLTGSGGGGAIIALTKDDPSAVQAALAACKLRSIRTVVPRRVDATALDKSAPSSDV